MSIFSNDTFLDRSRFSSYVPLDYVARLGCANYNIWLEGIKHCLCDFVLASESVFRSALKTQRKDVDDAVGLIVPELTAFAVTHQQ